MGGLAQADINVIPPREECAKTGANCLTQKCCMTTGYECYEVHSGFAQCMKSCTPGQDGTCLKNAPAMVPSKQSDVTYAKNTLFCWAFYTADTGSTKKSYELELLRTQLFLGASIFGCEEYRVYSDVDTRISPRKIKAEGAWTKWYWTVKVDIDAVFLPIRLRQYL